jgi:hypothetical protein
MAGIRREVRETVFRVIAIAKRDKDTDARNYRVTLGPSFRGTDLPRLFPGGAFGESLAVQSGQSH